MIRVHVHVVHGWALDAVFVSTRQSYYCFHMLYAIMKRKPLLLCKLSTAHTYAVWYQLLWVWQRMLQESKIENIASALNVNVQGYTWLYTCTCVVDLMLCAVYMNCQCMKVNIQMTCANTFKWLITAVLTLVNNNDVYTFWWIVCIHLPQTVHCMHMQVLCTCIQFTAYLVSQ